MRSEGADGMEKSADIDRLLLLEQSDLGLHFNIDIFSLPERSS